ncbi:MAG: 4-(cytidine 5'-diphospho)-2-C-methyl-D-erythritol kinase [Candidatus Riflebacteria bacterium]|nr:4-(cytidine 5'-diphospho)-2-C-methyl-D-erythritol kinase [Candidatus Riflebacteria bacterium]
MKRTLILQAPAKINIVLWVKEKRPDGYHELSSIMQSLSLVDTITLQETREEGIQIECDNPDVPRDQKNLVYKAAQLFFEHFGISPGIIIRIQKRIPIAAGLAGGSTDAGAVFNGLARLYDKGMTMADRMKLSMAVGSDVPFVIRGGLAVAQGRGELLNFFETPRPPLFVLIAVPKNIEVSTKWCYENYKPGQSKRSEENFRDILSAYRKRDLEFLKHNVFNDLESVTFKRHLAVADIKEALNSEGSGAVLMSGSGPSVFGLYTDRKAAIKAASRLDITKVNLFLEQTSRGSNF